MADIDYSPEQEAAHEAELARLRAIEQAAREYRITYQRDDAGADECIAYAIAARARLFALLERDADAP